MSLHDKGHEQLTLALSKLPCQSVLILDDRFLDASQGAISAWTRLTMALQAVASLL